LSITQSFPAYFGHDHTAFLPISERKLHGRSMAAMSLEEWLEYEHTRVGTALYEWEPLSNVHAGHS